MDYTRIRIEKESGGFDIHTYTKHSESDGPLYSVHVNEVRVNGSEVQANRVVFNSPSPAEVDVEYIQNLEGQHSMKRAVITLG